MRGASKIVAEVLLELRETIREGATTADMDAAEAAARNELGNYASRVRFTWDVASDPNEVRLHVDAANPRFLGSTVDALVGFDEISRTVVVRVEDFRQ